MHALTEVMGNVYFCDFESAEREPVLPARPTAARSAAADLKLLVAQISATSKEIVAAHAEIMRQAREQSRDLLALVNVIDSIVFQAGVTARDAPHLGATEMRELAQGAAGAANELLALAREEVSHARNAARRLADIGQRSGLVEQTVA
jgi:methyl-accepting chemotaxis protein